MTLHIEPYHERNGAMITSVHHLVKVAFTNDSAIKHNTTINMHCVNLSVVLSNMNASATEGQSGHSGPVQISELATQPNTSYIYNKELGKSS